MTMAVTVLSRRVPLDSTYTVQLAVNRCDGRPYLKLINDKKVEDCFYLSKEAFEAVVAEAENISAAWNYFRREGVSRSFVYCDGVEVSLPEESVGGLPTLRFSKYVTRFDKTHFPHMDICRSVWEIFRQKMGLVRESISKLESAVAAAPTMGVGLDGRTVAHVDVGVPTVIFTRTPSAEAAAWTYAMPLSAFVALRKYEARLWECVEGEEDVKFLLADGHGVNVQHFLGKMYVGFSKYTNNMERVKGCGMNLGVQAFKALMNSFDNLVESFHLSMDKAPFWLEPLKPEGEEVGEDAGLCSLEKYVSTLPKDIRGGMERLVLRMRRATLRHGSFNQAILSLLMNIENREQREKEKEKEKKDEEDEELSVRSEEEDEEADFLKGGESGYISDVDDCLKIVSSSASPAFGGAAPEAASTPRLSLKRTASLDSGAASKDVGKRKAEDLSAEAPCAPKKLVLAVPRRPKMTLYYWTWVDMQGRSLEQSYRFFVTEKQCLEHEREFRAIKVNHPHPFELKITTSQTDKYTGYMALIETLAVKVEEAVQRRMKEVCEGCDVGAANQMGHVEGCLEAWEFAVTRHAAVVLEQLRLALPVNLATTVLESLSHPVERVGERLKLALESKTVDEWQELVERKQRRHPLLAHVRYLNEQVLGYDC